MASHPSPEAPVRREPRQVAAPTVSVLMTVYNGERFLRAAIESLLAQTFGDFELVLVDDGSTDASPDIAASFGDPRLRLLRAGRVGRAEALNMGLRAARGRFVAVQDADDTSMPERLAKQVDLLAREPDAVLVACGFESMDDEGSIVATHEIPASHAELVDALAVGNIIPHSGVMFRRADALEAGGYPAEFVYAMDMALYLVLVGRGRLAAIPGPLIGLRRHSGQVSVAPALAEIRARDGMRLHQWARRVPGVSPAARRASQATVAAFEIAYAKARLLQGHHWSALGTSIRAFLRSPRTVLHSDEFRETRVVSRLLPAWRGIRRVVVRQGTDASSSTD